MFAPNRKRVKMAFLVIRASQYGPTELPYFPIYNTLNTAYFAIIKLRDPEVLFKITDFEAIRPN